MMFFGLFKRKKDHRTERQILGDQGEEAAARYLRRHGYKILLQKFRSGKAEVDIVARHKDWLVFVEVKTRVTENFGAPSENVDREKQRNVSKAAMDYLGRLGNPRIHFRFDVVEVVQPKGARRPIDIRIIPNAFDLAEPYLY
ncbi:MAG TPA: YraN family protein [Verrucomicrobiae bacterium]|nr:YraN family protein [Verrucomicrobiae bacterium]